MIISTFQMTSRNRTLLLVFALLGLGASVMSSYVHYQMLADPTYTSFCDVSATVSCTQAYLSPYRQPPRCAGGGPRRPLLHPRRADGRDGAAAAAHPGRQESPRGRGRRRRGRKRPGLCLRAVGDRSRVHAVPGLGIVVPAPRAVPALRGVVRRGPRAFRGARGERRPCRWPRCPVARCGIRRRWRRPDRARRRRVAARGRAGSRRVVPARIGGAEAAQESAPSYPPLTPEQRVQFEAWYNVQPVVDVPIDKGAAKVLIVEFNDYQCPPCRQTYNEYKGDPGEVHPLRQREIRREAFPAGHRVQHAERRPRGGMRGGRRRS